MNSPNSLQPTSDYHHHSMDTTSTSTSSTHPPNLPIPVDLFVSKKHPGLTRGEIGFADSSGAVVYRVKHHSSSSSSSSSHKRLLVDSSGNPLVSMYLQQKGQWLGFKGDSNEEKDLIFKVKRTVDTLSRTEFDVFLLGENRGDAASQFKMKGCVFQKSCTIYKGDSIVAQTSLMYKLRQLFVRRNKFRLTLFPGSVDTAFVVALIVIFFD